MSDAEMSYSEKWRSTEQQLKHPVQKKYPDEIMAGLRKAKADIGAEALAAEETVAYNLDLIHTLKRHVMEQSTRITALRARVVEMDKGAARAIAEASDRTALLERDAKALHDKVGCLAESLRVQCDTIDILAGGLRVQTRKLETAAERNATLERLVKRMGEELRQHRLRPITTITHPDIIPCYDLTLIGQRRHDAELHEAEGPPPDAGMLEGVQ